jgi:NAD(P)-dependent dehydrogenase (short-subunit alcohol dehydrogenase family)
MDLHLSGKVAVVTGASKGIGLAITQALSAEGVSVVAGALHGSPELDAVPATHSVQVDLTTASAPAALVDEAVQKFGGIDILVNNVGAVRPRTEGFLALTDADWDWGLTINFLAALRTMRAALPHLIARSGASIVTISSVNAFLPDPGVIDYSAAKGALTNLCKSLSKEFGQQVRVNTISPGPVQTDLWLADTGVAATVARATGSSPDQVAQHQAAQAPTGRFTYPREVADLVLMLVSDRAANITGSDFVIDGGVTASYFYGELAPQ